MFYSVGYLAVTEAMKILFGKPWIYHFRLFLPEQARLVLLSDSAEVGAARQATHKNSSNRDPRDTKVSLSHATKQRPPHLSLSREQHVFIY